MDNKLTSSEILQRVRGVGQAEADLMVDKLGLDDEMMNLAYADGGAAVDALLCEAQDNLPPEVDIH